MLCTYSWLQNLKDNLVIIRFGLWKNVSVVPMVCVKVLGFLGGFCFCLWVFFFLFLIGFTVFCTL